jgi:hypothetical protein
MLLLLAYGQNKKKERKFLAEQNKNVWLKITVIIKNALLGTFSRPFPSI